MLIVASNKSFNQFFLNIVARNRKIKKNNAGKSDSLEYSRQDVLLHFGSEQRTEVFNYQSFLNPTNCTLLPTLREGVCHSVHNRPHGYSVTVHPCYSAVGTHPTEMLCCILKVAQTEVQEVKKENAELRRSLNEALGSWTDAKQMTGKLQLINMQLIIRTKHSKK